jgi:hypothetical protein
VTELPIRRTCRDCRRRFAIEVDEQYFLRRVAAQIGGSWRLPARCTPCRKLRREAANIVPSYAPEAWHTGICIDCKREFSIGPRDIALLKARSWPWPKRCKPCREARRQSGD